MNKVLASKTYLLFAVVENGSIRACSDGTLGLIFSSSFSLLIINSSRRKTVYLLCLKRTVLFLPTFGDWNVKHFTSIPVSFHLFSFRLFFSWWCSIHRVRKDHGFSTMQWSAIVGVRVFRRGKSIVLNEFWITHPHIVGVLYRMNHRIPRSLLL